VNRKRAKKRKQRKLKGGNGQPDIAPVGPGRDGADGRDSGNGVATAAELRLVERCLRNDQGAWEELYQLYHPRLVRLIEFILRDKADDSALIDEIASRVWYELLRDDCRLLAKYDIQRDVSLGSFFMGLARIEILRYTRAEQRRMAHETTGGKRRIVREPLSDIEVVSMIKDFLDTLTPQERAFVNGYLMGDGNGDEEELDRLSPSNIWQRSHRIRIKLLRFFEAE